MFALGVFFASLIFSSLSAVKPTQLQEGFVVLSVFPTGSCCAAPALRHSAAF